MPGQEPHPVDRPQPAPGSGVWGWLGIAELLRQESSTYLPDPKFRRRYRQYIFQVGTAPAQ